MICKCVYFLSDVVNPRLKNSCLNCVLKAFHVTLKLSRMTRVAEPSVGFVMVLSLTTQCFVFLYIVLCACLSVISFVKVCHLLGFCSVPACFHYSVFPLSVHGVTVSVCESVC